MISLLITLIVIALIAYVCWWGLSQVPLPAPFDVVVRVIFALIIVLVLLHFLLPLAGIHAGFSW